jgi:hypothetical protein
MAVWKVQRLGRVSAASGDSFPPETEIVTALFGDDEELGEDRVRGGTFVRRDFLAAEATEERLAGAFCSWHTRTPAAKAEPERRFDLGMATEFLRRLLAEGRDDRAPVCLTLALLLARKRRITIVDQDAESLTCRWPGEKETFPVPAPAIAEAEAETLQQEMMRLFGFETVAPAEAGSTEAGSTEAPASEAPASEAPAETPADTASDATNDPEAPAPNGGAAS